MLNNIILIAPLVIGILCTFCMLCTLCILLVCPYKYEDITYRRGRWKINELTRNKKKE